MIIQVDVSIKNELSNAESNGKSSSTNEHGPGSGEDHTTAEKMRVMLQRKASRVNSQDLTGNHGRNQILVSIGTFPTIIFSLEDVYRSTRYKI